MMMICKSYPEINIDEAVEYEFSLVPRSFFTSDGSMLHCSTKSALMSAIEKHVNPKKFHHRVQSSSLHAREGLDSRRHG